MKCQGLFSWKIKKSKIILSSAEYNHRIIKVKQELKEMHLNRLLLLFVILLFAVRLMQFRTQAIN